MRPFINLIMVKVLYYELIKIVYLSKERLTVRKWNSLNRSVRNLDTLSKFNFNANSETLLLWS